MIIDGLKKIFWVLASAILLAAVGVAQTPPANQGSVLQLPKPRQLLLEVDLRIDAGAAATNNRALTLDFTALEKGDGNVTIQNDTAKITHYRALEDSTPEILSQQSWIPITRRPPFFNLTERDKQGHRYGERHVVFQVKTATLTSNIVSDSIALEPLLKEYKVSASGNVHPLFQYAAQQGFTFPLNYYETCKGNCAGNIVADPNLASGSATVSVQALSKDGNPSLICVLVSAASLGILTCRPEIASASPSAPAAAGTCTTKADYLLFEGRDPNRFWRIKSVDISGATVRLHGLNKFLVKLNFDNNDATCLPGRSISIGDVVVEGPVVDDFVDSANPWKNAFVRGELTRPLIGPTNPRPN